MIELRPDLLALVTQILARHVSQYEVRVFGSRVSGMVKQHSDLDLIIMSERPLPTRTMALLKTEFEESNLPIRVDVLDWATLTEPFQRVIENQYEVIQTPPVA